MPREPGVDRSEPPPRNPLRGIAVMDEAGAPVKLEELWSERPVILVFVRHFG